MSDKVFNKDYSYSAIFARYGYFASRLRSNQTPEQIRQALSTSATYTNLSPTQIDYFIDRFEIVASSYDSRFNNTSGLDAIFLKDKTSGEIFVSIAGVGPSNGSEFIPTAVLTGEYGFNDRQFSDLRQIMDSVRQQNSSSYISIFGHSLGGQLSEVLYADAILKGYVDRVERVITYGSYGVNVEAAYNFLKPNSEYVPDYRSLLLALNDYDQPRILNFYADTDLISLASRVVGNTLHGVTHKLIDNVFGSLEFTATGLTSSHNINAYFAIQNALINNSLPLPDPRPLLSLADSLARAGQLPGAVYSTIEPNGAKTLYWTSIDVVNGLVGPTSRVRLTVFDGKITNLTVIDGSNAESIVDVIPGSALETTLLRAAGRVNSSTQPYIAVEGLAELLNADTGVTYGSSLSDIDKAFLSAKFDSQGNLILTGHTTRLISYDPRTKTGRYAIGENRPDEFGRPFDREYTFNFVNGKYNFTGIKNTTDGKVIVRTDEHGPTTIRLANLGNVGIDFVSAGSEIGSTFGRYIAGDNVLVQTVTSAAFQTIGANFGDILNAIAFDGGNATTSNISHAFDGADVEFLSNLKDSALGAISSYLTAELVALTGLEGLPAEVLNSAAGYAIGKIVNNLAAIAGGSNSVQVFDGIANLKSLAFAAGSFIGTKLATTIVTWDEVGEQLGSSIGGTLGASVGQALIPIPVLGAAIGALLGNLIGGFIGGIFTGTPKSGAILGFDEATGTFSVESVWKEDGGKRAAARQLGETAADSLNGILSFIGGEVLNGGSVDAGSYGLRGQNYTYWQDGTSSGNRIKFKTAQDLVGFGVTTAANDLLFLGGDVYAKRAFYATIKEAGGGVVGTKNGDDVVAPFGLDTLLGNFAVVDRLKTYLASSGTINALIAAEPDSGFTLDWMLALSRASELGLMKRNTHDWDGGFSYLLKSADLQARDVGFSFEILGSDRNGERVSILGDMVLGDTVDTGSKTIVTGSEGSDKLTAQSGGSRLGAATGTAGHIANVFHGGDGDDRILAGDTGDDLFGDDGNDNLIGGALDDWLFGGAGDDVLDAGGGSGNVLVGGTGDDRLVGADGVSADPMNSGSDWLAAGDGDDIVRGRGGDDYLEGGEGQDRLDGGAGSDTYVYRAGDGRDVVSDSGGAAARDHDVVEFGRELSASDVTVVARSSGERITLLIGDDGADSIDLRGALVSRLAGIEEVNFTDERWSRGDVTARAVFAKTAGTTVTGTSADESLAGTAYDDDLSGGGGTDTLAGGDGSDVYRFNLGDGQIVIDELGHAADLDVLSFGAGIALTDLTFSHDPAAPQDLIIQVGVAGDRVVLRHVSLADGGTSIDEVRFADGTSLTLRDLERLSRSVATAGDDTLLGFDGNDAFQAGDGNDTITGGLGDDDLDGGAGSDTYVYNIGDGDDRILENYHSAPNTLTFGAGILAADIVATRDVGDPNNIRISFNNRAGSILLEDQGYGDGYGGAGVSTIRFADGTTWDRAALDALVIAQSISALADVVTDGGQSSTIAAGAGNDVVYAGNGDDILTGGTGDDKLDGGAGSDTYLYNIGDGDDRIVENYHSAPNTLIFGVGILATDIVASRDVVDPNNIRISFNNRAGSILLEDQGYGDGYGGAGVSTIQFADGTTWDRATLDALLIAQSVSGLADIVSDGGQSSTIAAGSGNDVIYARNGDDTLIGGTGNDNLYGGAGNDTYVYNVGDGDDRISEDYHGGANTLMFGAGIVLADLVVTREAGDINNLRISFNNRAGSILLDDQDLSLYGEFGGTGVSLVRFADGSTLDRAALAALVQAGSALADIVFDGAYGNTIATGAGDDVVYSRDGNDTLIGGAGNDNLYGGAGNDTYVYNIGDGEDRISEDYHGGANTLVFGAGIVLADLVVTRETGDTNNLRISFSNRAGSILLDDQELRLYGEYGGTGVALVRFADGTTLDRAALAAMAASLASMTWGTGGSDAMVGTAGNDRLAADSGDDILTGGVGDDYLAGGSGDDTYVFNLGDGHDTIAEELGFDTVRFGTGISVADLVVTATVLDGDVAGMLITIAGTDDSIYLRRTNSGDYHDEVDRFVFADGTILTSADLRARLMTALPTAGADEIFGTGFADVVDGGLGNDRIATDAGNDTLTGGKGDDYLAGGSGDDTYVFNLGDGHDTIAEELGFDTVRFGAGITAADIIVRATAVDGDVAGMLITIAGTDDSIYLRRTNSGDYHDEVDRFVFADGTILTSADLRARLMTALPTAGADEIFGTGFADVVDGGLGNDRIATDAGNDTLTGGKGDDYLAGGSGDDTYVFNLGDGHDTIAEELGFDTVRFGAGITAADIIVRATAVDGDVAGMLITIAGTDDSIYLRRTNSGDYHDEVDRFVFADGTILTSADLRARLMTALPTAGADEIFGTGFADVVDGGLGNDRIATDAGNDTLTGGKGDDYLAGGGGDDTYVFNIGDGFDTIEEQTGNDTLQLGEGIDESDVVLTRSSINGYADGVLVSIKGTTDHVYLRAGASGYYDRVDNIAFKDGTVWDSQTMLRLLEGTTIGGSHVAVTMGDDVIAGSDASDTIRGERGDDVIRGGAGSDTYRFARGDGYDTIYEPGDQASTDRLVLEGLASTDVAVFVSPTDADDLILYFDDASVVYLDQQNVANGGGIEEVQFADGVIWSRAQLAARAASGGASDGNDRLFGTNFADTLHGGLGSDLLEGRGGGDTYRYALGDGDDTIDESIGSVTLDAASLDRDRILFGDGIVFADLRLAAAAGGDLILTIAGQAGSILLKAQDLGGSRGIETLAFADGSSFAFSALRAVVIGSAATDGDDTINGFASDDVLGGGLGNDTLIGGHGADVYRFGLGDGIDTIVEAGGAGENSLVFAAGIAAGDLHFVRKANRPADLLLTFNNGMDQVVIRDQFGSGQTGIDRVLFADGTSWSRNQIIALMAAQPASADDDYLVGSAANDTIDGLGGDDTILGEAGDDVLQGGAGNDALSGGVGADTLSGGDGDDIVSGDEGVDTLDGGAGFDTADYSFSLDRWAIDLAAGTAAIIGAGQDTTETLTGFEAATGGLGSDHITGNGAANTLRGGVGDDLLSGGGGGDLFLVDGTEDGVDTVDGGDGFDTIGAVSDGTQIGLAAVTGVERISAAGHSDVSISTTDAADTLDLSGVELVGIDRIMLGGGDDELRFSGAAGDAADIDGGSGNDRIAATADHSVLRFRSLSGVETVSGGGFADVVVERGAGAETTDLTTVTYDGIARYDLLGGDDTFVGGASADVVRGDAGNDTLRGNAGDDTFDYIGGANGFDTIDGGVGHDRIVAAGDDTVIGVASIVGVEEISAGGHTGVTIRLGDAADDLDLTGVTTTGLVGIALGAGADVFRGSAGADVVAGGTGNDTLYGGRGDDVYRFGSGDGQDVISEASNTQIGGGTDAIAFGPGISAGDISITLSSDGQDYLVTVGASGDTIRLAGAAGSDQANWIEEFRFADGTIWNRAAIVAAAAVRGTGGDDTIALPANYAVVDAGAGNDQLSVNGNGGGRIIFRAGDGHDVLDNPGSGYHRDDVLVLSGLLPNQIALTREGDELNVKVVATGATFRVRWQFWNNSPDYGLGGIEFSDGTTWDRARIRQEAVVRGGVSNDNIYGTDQDDALAGGGGNDYLEGRYGSDAYSYASGDGDDRIYEAGSNVDVDRLIFTDLNPADISWRRDGVHLYAKDLATGAEIRIDNQFYSDSTYGLEQIVFADGTTWDRSAIQQAAWIRGDANGNALYGSNLGETFVGNGGDDYLEGGYGSDTYRYASGDGSDRINEAGDSGDVDTLKFLDLDPANISLRRNGVHLYAKDLSTGGELRIDNQFYSNETYGLERIVFADGTVWDRAAIQQAAWLRGTSADENIYGSNLAETLVGETGNDYLAGGYGSDTYRYASGDGSDRIYEAGSASDVDVLRLTDLNSANVALRRDSVHLFVRDLTTGQEIRIDNQFYSDATYGVEQIVFADGVTWDRAAMQQAAWLRGTSAGENIYGSGLGETLVGYGGDDYLAGGGGSDTYRYASGDGADRIDEAGSAADSDTLALTDLNAAGVSLRHDSVHLYVKDLATGQEIRIDNQFYSDATYGIEQLLFGDGTIWDRERIRQEAWFRGNDDANNLSGTNLDDTFSGGGGDDTINGGDGTDTAVYAGAKNTFTLFTTGGVIRLADGQSGQDGDEGTDTLNSIETLRFKNGETTSLALPIVLDLDGDGVALTSIIASAARFDFNGDGIRDLTSWIGTGDAFLFLDRNKDGTVSDAAEISFARDMPGAASDLAGLAAFDTNGDRILSQEDAAFRDFGLWRDANGNGLADAGEISSLADAGVVSIGLVGTPTEATWGLDSGVALNMGSFVRTDGSVGSFADAALVFQAASAASKLDSSVSPLGRTRQLMRHEYWGPEAPIQSSGVPDSASEADGVGTRTATPPFRPVLEGGPAIISLADILLGETPLEVMKPTEPLSAGQGPRFHTEIWQSAAQLSEFMSSFAPVASDAWEGADRDMGLKSESWIARRSTFASVSDLRPISGT